jgi:hypothetical protein
MDAVEHGRNYTWSELNETRVRLRRLSLYLLRRQALHP